MGVEVDELVWAVSASVGGRIEAVMARVEKMGTGERAGMALVMTEEDKALWWPVEQLHAKWDGQRPRRDSFESKQRASRKSDLAMIEGANRSLWDREKGERVGGG